MTAPTLADRLDDALPQTQCTRCGYPDCRGYAEAIAAGKAPINRCPPGGDEGVARLARLTGHDILPLDTACGNEGPLRLALIDESWCIGCTLCIKACPVDCIVGAPKAMHTVLPELCTGCELCIPACPVDCISMEPPPRADVTAAEPMGWAAWSSEQAATARGRYRFHQWRVARDARENDERLAAKAAEKLSDLAAHSRLTDGDHLAAKRAVIEAAMERAKARAKARP